MSSKSPTLNKNGKPRKVKSHKCRNCETADIIKFHPNNKSLCIECKKKDYRDKKSKKVTIKSKKCRICNKTKLSKDFYETSNSDGLFNECKICSSNIVNNRRKKQRLENPQKCRDYDNNYRNTVRILNEIEVILSRLRVRNYHYLKRCNIIKKREIKDDIGCSPLFLSEWIKYNCELDNLSEYHIDHVFPLSRFGCKIEQDVYDCNINHWTNLKPLTENDNLTKHNRLPTNEELETHNKRIIDFIKIIYSTIY